MSIEKEFEEKFGEVFIICRGEYFEKQDEIKQFYREKIQDMVDVMIGEEDICNEELWYEESGVDREDGGKLWLKGYNMKRIEI